MHYVWLTVFVKNNDEILDSIMDAEGITFNVKDKKQVHIVQKCHFGNDDTTGKKVTLAENSRYNHLLVVGHAGMGKTEYVLEPMIAKDIKKKRFLLKLQKDQHILF